MEFERIFAHAINHICFGQDHNDDRFDFEFYDRETKTFTMRKVSLREGVINMTSQCDASFFTLLGNPISATAKILFDVDLKIGSFFDTVKANTARLHAHIDKYVQDRKAGVTKSEMEGNDLLTAFLENTDVFTDEMIVDGLIGLIFAAIDTSNLTSQSLI